MIRPVPGDCRRRFLSARRFGSPSFLFFLTGVAALALASAWAGDGPVAPAVSPEELRPVKDSHMCGCGASCGCGDACGCADSTTIESPRGAGMAGFDAENVALLSRISLPEFGPGIASGNDCWGYTSPSGREYAIMGLNNAAAFVEITDPRNPQVLQLIPHSASLWADIKVYQHYAYIVNETEDGLQVVDMSQIDSGVVTLVNSVTASGLRTTHNLAINEASGFLYLCGANSPTGGLVAVSLANPASPVIAGVYNAVYVHDAHVVTYTAGPYAGREIAFCFVGGTGIDIVDVTNKGNMFRMSRTTYAGLSYSHQGWLDMERQLLFMDDELDEPDDVATTTTRVFDVSNLSQPQYLGSFTTGLPAIDHNQYLRDGILYQANYRSGLRIFDTRTSATFPDQVGYFDTYPVNDDARFNGAWSVYPYFPSGTVIVSDIEGGLFVLDVAYALAGGAPLAFSFPEGRPETIPNFGGTVLVEVTTLNGATLDETSLRLHVDSGGGFVETALAHVGGSTYRASFPVMPCGATASYYITGESVAGVEVVEPLSAPSVTHTALVAASLEAVFEDDFETNQGWQVGAPGDTATSGIWVRAAPVGTAAQPGAPAGEGTMCFVTGNATPGSSVGNNDVDGGATTLTSPRMDASGGLAYLTYYRWYSNNQGASPNTDTMPVLISNDDGASWTELELVSENAGSWVRKTWLIDEVIAPTSMMRVRFVARDLSPASVVEAAVDDVRIDIVECLTPEGADLNGDGAVGAADLAMMLGAWGPCPAGCAADLNGDNAVTAADLAIMLGSWS